MIINNMYFPVEEIRQDFYLLKIHKFRKIKVILVWHGIPRYARDDIVKKI